MAVPAPATPAGQAKPAMENTPPVLAHHLILGTEAPAPAQVLINTPAPVPATPAAPALPAVENIINVIVQVIIVGMVAVVLFLVHQVINIHAPVRVTRVAPAPPVVASMRLVPAPLQKQTQNGAVGELYYCNGKVVGVRATGMGFYVALRDLGQMNWSSANSQCQSYAFCGNVKGTLPTVDQLKSIYQNKSRVNSLLSTNGGTKMTEGWYWSSTHSGGDYYYIVSMPNGVVYDDGYRNYVRPVLASY